MRHLRLVLTDAVLEFGSLWREWIVTFVDLLPISVIVGFSKILEILSTDVDAMVRGGINNQQL